MIVAKATTNCGITRKIGTQHVFEQGSDVGPSGCSPEGVQGELHGGP